jgi:hypothetical protein
VAINIRSKVPPTVKSIIPPMFMTRSDRRDGTRSGRIPDAVLRFTDLISGPATGLGDSLGSGVIVTIWGQGLGDELGEVLFTDSLGVERSAAHIYYWKRADGVLPSGPANLWESHLMYEVAFSIPSGSADGLGSIRIRKPNAGSYSVNTLPFTVRAGRILWVDPTGDNTNAGTFSSPKAFINGGNPNSSGLGNYLQAGDTIYSRGVIETPVTPTARDGLYVRQAAGNLAQQIMIVSYPNTLAQIHGYQMGFHTYESRGVGLSKYKVMTGNQPPSPSGELVGGPECSHVKSCQEGRFVGLEITDNPLTCTTGQGGAIVSNNVEMDKSKYLGCHLHDIGCDGTSHYQHTMYLSSRGPFTVEAPEVAFMHLKDCRAKFGVHVYDQADEYNRESVMTGTVSIHDNVIFRQKGAGISAHGACPWTAGIHIYNNILIECGKGPVAEIANGTSAEAMYLGVNWQPVECRIEDNLIVNYSDASSRLYSPAAVAYVDFKSNITDYRITRNVMISNGDFETFRFAASNIAVPTLSEKNAFISTDPSNTKSLPVGWTDSIQNVNLKMSVVNTLPDVQLSSPLNIAGTYSRLSNYDIYGRVRTNTLGPVEAV